MIKNLFLLLCTAAVLGGCSLHPGESVADNRRFLSLAASLETFTDATRTFNFEREDLILRNIYDQMLRGDQRNTLLKNDLDENKKRAAAIYLALHQAKTKLEEIGGMDLDTEEWNHPEERNGAQAFMLGSDPGANESRGEGFALEIHRQIDAYAAWGNGLIARLNRDMNSPIKKDYLPNPVIDPEHDYRTWEEYSFLGASAASAYAELARLEMDVALVEGDLLDYFHILTRSNWATEVQMQVLESVNERTVDAGKEFVAQFRLGTIYHEARPEYLTEGKVEVQEDGSVVIRWKAKPASQVNEKGLGVQPYSLEVKIPTAAGTDRSIRHQGEFYVRQ
jgi:hypothetical protein